jgi:hypothetical protein
MRVPLHAGPNLMLASLEDLLYMRSGIIIVMQVVFCPPCVEALTNNLS